MKRLDLACPACDSPEYRVLFQATDRLYRTTDTLFQVIECGRCRLLRLNPRPSGEELRRYYPEHYWFSAGASQAAHLEDSYRRFVLSDQVEFVRRALRDSRESGPVLDVGCGGGLFLHQLLRGGIRVLGLDISARAASLAWRVNAVPAVCASLPDAPLAPESVAVLTMFHVLEHLEDPFLYLAAAHDLLKPNGRLVVQVPNAACWQFLLLGENWNGLDVPRHLLDFRAGDLEKLLDACGFEVVRRKFFSLRDNPAGLATSLAPGLEPVARRVRGVPESPRRKLLKDLLYFALVVASVPFAVLEAACRAGSTITVEARKKGS